MWTKNSNLFLFQIATGCISGLPSCPKTPLALFGQGLWCGAFGYIAAALCIFGANRGNLKYQNAIKNAIGFVSIFDTLMASSGAIIDGYGCFSLIRCPTCALFENHVTTLMFTLLAIGNYK